MADETLRRGAARYLERRRDWPLEELRRDLFDSFGGLSEREVDALLQRHAQSSLQLSLPTAARRPYVTVRLLAEQGFWTLSPGGQMTVYEFEDLTGTLSVVPSGYGPPGIFEALVMNALVSKWCAGPRDSPVVEASASEIADLLGVSFYGGLADRINRAVEVLKVTTFRYVELHSAGGATDLFSLLDRVQTRWDGAPTSPRRRITTRFSDVVTDALGNRRMIRPIDLETIRRLGEQRDFARRLFLFIESSPGHRSGDHELIERVLDQRLAGTIGAGANANLAKLRPQILRAAGAIHDASHGRYEVDVVPRVKQGLRKGDPRYLLRVLRRR